MLGKLSTILLGLLIIFTWVIFLNNFLEVVIGLNHIPHHNTISIKNFFFLCIIAPLWEELAFRYVPITIASIFNKELVLPVIILSSIIFGWGHGNGTMSLLYQGVMGGVFSYVYVKNGYHYLSAVAIHFLWNLVCFLYPI